LRIVISSPPKMGNKWLKCLLSRTYGLTWINGDDTPDTNVEEFKRFIAEGRFPDDTIFHQHSRYKRKMCDAIDAVPAHLVTIVRDPYDAFVSMYHWLQTRSKADEAKGKVRRERPRDVLLGKPIDDPAVLEYLATGFGDNIVRADEWIRSGRAVVVRYEDLHRDTIAEMTRITKLIEPVDAATIEAAVEACSVENMRKMSDKMAQHVRTAKVGDSREKLSDVHLAIFREKYGDLIGSLGYEVR
jgi:hypothetical protein